MWETEGYVETGTLVTGDGWAEGSVNWGNYEGGPWKRSTRYRQRVEIGL